MRFGPGLSLALIACLAVGSLTSALAAKPSPSMVKIRWIDEKGTPTSVQTVARVVKTDAEWQRQLSAEEYHILRGKGTERPFCGVFHDHKKRGIYTCLGCDLPMFSADTKFDSGTGWPSFFQPIARENIEYKTDRSHGMTRTEILCNRCGGHLGHVFDDGPPPTGKRYCLNSASLKFVPLEEIGTIAAAKPL